MCILYLLLMGVLSVCDASGFAFACVSVLVLCYFLGFCSVLCFLYFLIYFGNTHDQGAGA